MEEEEPERGRAGPDCYFCHGTLLLKNILALCALHSAGTVSRLAGMLDPPMMTHGRGKHL